MCKCFDYSEKVRNEEHPDQAFPQVLLAVTRLERKAQKDYRSVRDDWRQVEEMRTILGKLTTSHIDSDNYANYLFKRAEQLSAHLETYKKIVGKIDIGTEIEKSFEKVSKKFIEYLKSKLEFKTLWIDSLETIEIGKRTVEEKVLVLASWQTVAENAYEAKNYFDLGEIRTKCDEELAFMNELMESCLACGKRGKEYGSHLYDQLTELEVCFQEVVRHSMNRINEMKRTPVCDKAHW